MKNNDEIAHTLGALAHETRLAVFRLLAETGPEGLPAGTLAERLDLAPNALSFHLTRLRHAGLVDFWREGQQIRYAAGYAQMGTLVAFLTEHCCRDGATPCTPVCGPASGKDSDTPSGE
ncbi:MAG TPA: metalloregulator ArsR/SmtB family transcription factor [Gammaproteobacteria bacterium]|nr:metalloregulator ArsR/SmtB family transcription factor [Gammaproteobacteria bacterium]